MLKYVNDTDDENDEIAEDVMNIPEVANLEIKNTVMYNNNNIKNNPNLENDPNNGMYNLDIVENNYEAVDFVNNVSMR